MRARLKTEVWDVWQYRGLNPRPLWVLNCTDLIDGVFYLAPRDKDRRRIEPGEWLVRDGLDDIPSVETDENFQRGYEVVA